MLTLETADAVVTLAPEHGGRIAQIVAAGRRLLADGDAASHPMMWGSFPMAPWAGRVRHGRFELDGTTYQLPLGLPPHAIHGTTYLRAWDVTERSATAATMRCALDWELGGTASQRIVLGHASLECQLAVEAGDRAMPAELGWHPWFTEPDELVFAPAAMYALDAEGIPTGALVDPPPGPWDDCFVNHEPVVLRYPDLTVTLTADCTDWVVYDRPATTVCVEPQSGPPDAFTLRPRRLAPGEVLRRTFRIAWSRTPVTYPAVTAGR